MPPFRHKPRRSDVAIPKDPQLFLTKVCAELCGAKAPPFQRQTPAIRSVYQYTPSIERATVTLCIATPLRSGTFTTSVEYDA